jgi:hypothetical protein
MISYDTSEFASSSIGELSLGHGFYILVIVSPVGRDNSGSEVHITSCDRIDDHSVLCDDGMIHEIAVFHF